MGRPPDKRLSDPKWPQMDIFSLKWLLLCAFYSYRSYLHHHFHIISTLQETGHGNQHQIFCFFLLIQHMESHMVQVKSRMVPYTLFHSPPFQILLVLFFSSELQQAPFHLVIYKCESWQNVGAGTRHVLLKCCGDISWQKQACVVGMSGVVCVLTTKMMCIMFSYIWT